MSVSVGGEASSADLEAGAVLLFTTLAHCERVGSREAEQLQAFFGPYPAGAATKVSRRAQHIFKAI